MSLSRPVTKRSDRVTSKSSKVKWSPPQAHKTENKIEAFHQFPASPQAAQPDSGFFENVDSDFDSVIDKSLPSHGNTNEDWILYANEDVSQEDGYFFQEEDGLDIASVKANPGSTINGNSNESFSSSLSYKHGRFHLNVIYESPRQPEPPTHVFTHHPTTQASVSTLQRWIYTHEQHEELAYYFEQPPHTTPHHHQSQYSHVWSEDIDLSLYDVRN